MKDYSVLLTCGESTMIVIHDAFDKGYQQGYKDAKNELGQTAIDLAHEESDRAYQQGLEDAWEAAKKIKRMDIAEKDAIFAEIGKSTYSVIMDMSASEVITKIKEYEEKQKQDAIQAIQVGDEVVGVYGSKGVVVGMDIYEDEVRLSLLMRNHKVPQLVKASWFKTKTGKHFPQIAEVLKEMRGE